MIRPASRRTRGHSLVELMIGLALGLFIVACASTLLAAQSHEQRGQAAANRLTQDLRTAADVVLRDLRRAGHWGAAASAVWRPGADGVAANPYSALAPELAASAGASFRYSRDAVENGSVDTNETFGLRLRNGAIELALGAGQWQALTDTGTLTVTAFTVVPTVQEITLQDHCATPCPPGATSCPRQLVRSLVVQITARSSIDAAVERSVRGEVRVRNDAVLGACSA